MYLFLYFLSYPVRELFSQQLPRRFLMCASSKDFSLDFLWAMAAWCSSPLSAGTLRWDFHPPKPGEAPCPPQQRDVCDSRDPGASLDGAGGPWLPKRSQPRPSCGAGDSPAVLWLLGHLMVSGVKSAFPALSLLWSLPARPGILTDTQGKSCPREIQGEHLFT